MTKDQFERGKLLVAEIDSYESVIKIYESSYGLLLGVDHQNFKVKSVNDTVLSAKIVDLLKRHVADLRTQFEDL